jgi:hypothetical protein
MREASARLQHPLVQAREARVDAELVLLAGDPRAAQLAVEQQARIARGAGLQEWSAEADLLHLRASQLAGESPKALRSLAMEVEALAEQQGFADLRWRAAVWLATHEGTEDDARRAHAALALLRGGDPDGRFDAEVAARHEPRPY